MNDNTNGAESIADSALDDRNPLDTFMIKVEEVKFTQERLKVLIAEVHVLQGNLAEMGLEVKVNFAPAEEVINPITPSTGVSIGPGPSPVTPRHEDEFVPGPAEVDNRSEAAIQREAMEDGEVIEQGSQAMSDFSSNYNAAVNAGFAEAGEKMTKQGGDPMSNIMSQF